MNSEKPSLKNYLNIHHYLEEIYKYRKKNEPAFSYETWSQELGFKNRSFLRQIVMGRRALTEATIKIFCQRMNYDESEKEYFYALVQYSKSSSQAQRNIYGKKLTDLIKADYQQVPVMDKAYQLVAKPLYPRLLTILSFKDISKSVASLAHLLKTSEAEITQALQILEEMSLAGKNPEYADQWQSKQVAFKVPEKLGDEAILDFHEQSLKEAINARSSSKNDRRYRSLLVPLSPTEFADYLEDLQAFAKQILHKYDVDDLRGRKLFQINFNLHDVSAEPSLKGI